MKYTLTNLTVLGCVAVLTSFAYGRAYVAPLPHTVYQQPTAEVDWGYELSDIRALDKIVERALLTSLKRRVKVIPSKPAALPLMASLYHDNAAKEEQIALDLGLGDKEVQDKLWGRYTDKDFIEAERKLWE